MSTTTTDTARRLNELYGLRKRIDEEIQALEGAMARATTAHLRAVEQGVSLRRRKARTQALCGTDGGYYRHRRTLKEPACEACKVAHRVAEAERTERRQRRIEAEKAKSREAS